ncbi:MAG: ABC transporter permease subunit, partial [Acidobacteria bacterium]|nr:ABC transporter permease subunit [Acidobacteriota bacterium]
MTVPHADAWLNDPAGSALAGGKLDRIAGVIAHECRDHLRSSRFSVGATITLLLCVLAAMVRIGDFRAAHTERDEFSQRWMVSVAEQLQRDETIQIDNVRAASPLGVLSVGLEPITPARFSSTKEGIRFGESRAAQSVVDALFGRLDLAFIVGTLLSLFALALTFDSICGERSQGTLSIVLSYPISRRAILVAKSVAAAAVVGACFVIGLIAVATSQLFAGIPILSPAAWIAFAGLSLSYLLVFVGIGLAVS